ncbi:hypothetical protein [Roseomonas sp. USHLN139]|uniref:hypothetical protein n=1 Tax=Roseomonas sp. USHLN139 TaxID=3081298 RepID=UPI003B021080
MSSHAHPPPVPPAGRPPQGQDAAPRRVDQQAEPAARSTAEQNGLRRGDNLAQNTRHQGHQQDR